MVDPIIHLITSTRVGGAECALERLLMCPELKGKHLVVSMTPMGEVGQRLQIAGVKVESLGMGSINKVGLGVMRWIGILRCYRPRLVVSWMYHANILALVSRYIGRRAPVVWNVRCDLSDYARWPQMRKLILGFSGRLSSGAERIIFNSYRSMSAHCQIRYPVDTSQVIYNGFDISLPSPSERIRSREALGISPSTFLVGGIGRNVPVKRMDRLLTICRMLVQDGCPCELLLVGRGYDTEIFQKQIEAAGVADRVHRVGEVRDVGPCMASLDILCICSDSEGFPNTAAEAAFRGIPVAAMDVGDLSVFLSPCQIGRSTSELTEKLMAIYQLTQTERNQLIQEQSIRYRTHTQLEKVVSQFNFLFEQQSL